MEKATVTIPKQKVRSSAAHMPTRAMRDRSKYTRKGRKDWRQ